MPEPTQSKRDVVEGLLDDLEAQTFNVTQSGPDAFLNERSGRDETRSRILSIVEQLEREVSAYHKGMYETEQILGRALGYPAYKDDQKNFPGATDKDGVCTGEHIASTLAAEIAAELATLRSRGEGETDNLECIQRLYDMLMLVGRVERQYRRYQTNGRVLIHADQIREGYEAIELAEHILGKRIQST